MARVPSSSTGPSIFNSCGKIGEKSVKEVRFSMKSNLIWKPHSPLPPHSSCATLIGNALNKGVPLGPICIMKESYGLKSVRWKPLSAWKSQKILKSISPNAKLICKRRSNVLQQNLYINYSYIGKVSSTYVHIK